jgi:hypothetical protein
VKFDNFLENGASATPISAKFRLTHYPELAAREPIFHRPRFTGSNARTLDTPCKL